MDAHYINASDRETLSDIFDESFEVLSTRSVMVLAARLLNKYPKVSSWYNVHEIAAAMNGIIGKPVPSYHFPTSAIVKSEKLRQNIFNGSFDRLRCLI